MNNWISFFYSALLFTILSFHSIDAIAQTENESYAKATNRTNQKLRSITFLIGKDKSSNLYYSNAAQYFRQHEAGKNNKVIISPLSLIEILSYLNTIPKQEQWDKINIVSHGNEWTGLAMKVKPKGHRTTLESISKTQKNNQIPTLRKGIFNENSHVIIYACGLGLNQPLMYKLKEVFTADISPKISSTKLFNLFSVGKTTSVHSLANFYNSFYKTNQNASKPDLINQLKQRYPEAKINWNTALSRKLPDTPGQAFSYKFKIPIRWTEVYKEQSAVPILKTEIDIIEWVKNQTEFIQLIDQYDIPINKYQWSVQYKEYSTSNNESRPAMYIKGKTTVMSVLKEVIDPISLETYLPSLDDERYFLTL